MCVCGCVFYVSCRAAKVMRTWIVDGCCVFLRLSRSCVDCIVNVSVPVSVLQHDLMVDYSGGPMHIVVCLPIVEHVTDCLLPIMSITTCCVLS